MKDRLEGYYVRQRHKVDNLFLPWTGMASRSMVLQIVLDLGNIHAK